MDKVIFVTGAPCVGKGYISNKFIKENPEYKYFSTGDYARELGMNPNEKSIQNVGISVEFDKLINEKVIELATSNQNIIIDGYPRSPSQISIIKSLKIRYSVCVVDAPDDTILDRYKNRKRGEDTDVFMGRLNASREFQKLLVKSFNLKIINNY